MGYHGGHEEGGDEEGWGHEEGCHEGCSDEEGDEEGEEGRQRDEGSDEGPSHEEGNEEGQGVRGGLRAKPWGGFEEFVAADIVACRCGYTPQGMARVCSRMGGLYDLKAGLSVCSLVCLDLLRPCLDRH